MSVKCETCGQMCDEVNDADECEDCHDAWIAKEYAYWKPLYDGEVLAGLHNPDAATDE